MSGALCFDPIWEVAYLNVEEPVLHLQREQALRRKGQHGQDVGIAAPSTAQQHHVSSTEATAPSDLRFDVPTGAHKLPCDQCYQQVLLKSAEDQACI